MEGEAWSSAPRTWRVMSLKKPNLGRRATCIDQIEKKKTRILTWKDRQSTATENKMRQACESESLQCRSSKSHVPLGRRESHKHSHQGNQVARQCVTHEGCHEERMGKDRKCLEYLKIEVTRQGQGGQRTCPTEATKIVHQGYP